MLEDMIRAFKKTHFDTAAKTLQSPRQFYLDIIDYNLCSYTMLYAIIIKFGSFYVQKNKLRILATAQLVFDFAE